MNYITEEQAIGIHNVLVNFFYKDGDPISPSGVKSHQLLSSALFRPQTSIGEVEKYKTYDEKAAALLCAIIQNHAFYNGNKRTALLCTLAFYETTGNTLDVEEDELYDFLVAVARNEINGKNKNDNEEVFFNEVVKWLRCHRYSYRTKFSDVSIGKFKKKCKEHGASIKKSKGSYVISHEGKSIRVSCSTKKISASAVKTYLTELKMTQAYSGVVLDVMLENGLEHLNCFNSLLPLLRRLAIV